MAVVYDIFSAGRISGADNKATINEDSGCSLMARIQGPDAVDAVQSAIASISYGIRNMATGSAIVAAGTALAVSATVFDALQTDYGWSADASGFNFKHDVTASAMATGDVLHQIEHRFTPTSGEGWGIRFLVSTQPLLGS